MKRTCLGFLCIFGLVVSTLALTGVSLANGRPVKVEAELEPCCGEPEPEAGGEAERRTQGVRRDDFKGKVDIPIPSPGLGIADRVGAAAAVVLLSLSHAGTPPPPPYAECLLEFAGKSEAENGDGEDEDKAHYRVDVRLRRGDLQEKKGTCDIIGTGPGVPDVQVDDVATATLVVEGSAPLDFLEGTFEKD